MGCSKSSSKREVYSNTVLPQEQEKSQINNLTLHLKQLEKEEQNKPKVSRRKKSKRSDQKYMKKRRRATILQPVEQKPHSQKDRQDEKAEGYLPDEGTR